MTHAISEFRVLKALFFFDSPLTRNWLSNETNNIALWGKIMSDELKRRSLMKALVSYNVGPCGMMAYIDSGNTVVSHEYIRGIKSRLKYVR